MNGFEVDKLLYKISLGDNAAFEELYEKTKRGTYAFLYSYLHCHADVEDAVQTVYLKVKTHISSYQRGTNGRAWLLQIAKNQALTELKKKSRTVPLEEYGDHGVDAPYSMGVTEMMERVLGEDEQKIVTLHVLWKYKHREIAEMLGVPVGTVTSKYKRAVAKLKTALEEEQE